MFIPLLLSLMFITCVFLLFYLDVTTVNSYDKIHDRLKSGEKFTHKQLIEILDYPTSKKYNDDGVVYRFVGHSTGSPVRIMTVYFDNDYKYVKHKYSIGFENVD